MDISVTFSSSKSSALEREITEYLDKFPTRVIIHQKTPAIPAIRRIRTNKIKKFGVADFDFLLKYNKINFSGVKTKKKGEKEGEKRGRKREKGKKGKK